MFTANTTYDSSQKIWSGESNGEKKYPKTYIGEVLFESLKKNPADICQISDTNGVIHSLTNEEMLTHSIRIAQNLNMKEGEIIGFMTVSSPFQAPAVFAAFLGGTIFHPISPFFDQNIVRNLFRITKPNVIFCDANNYEVLEGACKELDLKPRIYTINGGIEGVGSVHDLMEPTGKEETFRPQKCRKDADDTAMVICSSGTTGLPKGVCISHSYILETNPTASGFILFTFSNLDWITGVNVLLLTALTNGRRICTGENFSPKKLREIIEKYKVNFLMLAGSQLSCFVKSGEAQRCDSSSVRMLAVGGANVSHPLYVEMQKYLKSGIVSNVYGGTEFGGVALNTNVLKPKAVGKLSNGIKARIIDDDGVNLGIGESGEILVCNGRKWAGYYGNPAESHNILDKDGWYHTGDIGFFDKDGDLHVIDRKKEIMKFRGFHYSAQEIENCILAIDDVVEVCVFGTKTDEDGDLPTAAVVKKPESKLTDDEILDHVAKEMYEAKQLRGGVFFVQEIPKTGSGKYIRTKTRDMCLAIKRG